MTTDLIPIDRTPEIEGKALVVIEALVPAVVFGPGGIDALIEKLRVEVLAIPRDISTEKGRRAIKSTRYRVARSKTAIDDMGKALTIDLRAQVDAVNADRNKSWAAMEALADEVMTELNAWDARCAAHEVALAEIRDLVKWDYATPPRSEQVTERIQALGMLHAERDWQEFSYRATQTRQSACEILTQSLKDAHRREAEAARLEQERIEAARLAAEEAGRIQAEREAEIARQAAERARIAAEQAAATEARRIAELERQERARIEQEAALKLAAEKRERDRIEKAAADAKALAQVLADALERDRVEAVNRAVEAERQRAEEARRAALREKEAAQKAESDRVKAALKADEDRAKAVLAERQHQQEAAQDAARAAADAETARISDKKRRALVNNEIKADLTAAGFDAETAHAVVVALAKGIVRHVKVQY